MSPADEPLSISEWLKNPTGEPFGGAQGCRADQPLSDCSDLLVCPKCYSHRVERFTVDRFIVLACADCGTYETETTSDR